MPRGVPANGKRQPRSAAGPQADAPLAAASLDAEDRSATPADLQTRPESADELIEIPTVDLIGERVDDDVHVPEPVELTPEQQEIKRLRDQLAQATGKKDIEPIFEDLAQPGASGNILIHFLEDGLTALGQVWYRGQELEFEPNSRAYKDTFNRLGQSWLSLAGNDFAQVEKWGKVMFRLGPWPGKTYLDGEFEPMRAETGESRLRPPAEEELARADKMRVTKRSAPRLPEQV